MATRLINDSTGGNTAKVSEVPSGPQARRSTMRSRRMRGLLVVATVASLIAPSTGCMLVNGIQRGFSRHDSLDEFMVNYRNRAWAARAWLCRKDRYAGHSYLADLEAGFRQGYEDVAAGGSGCLPAVCPRSYWGWQYQSADGQARMNAWFEGYPLGVQAAEQDGVGHWGNVGTAFPHHQPAPLPASLAGGAGAGETGAVPPEPLTPPAPVPLANPAMEMVVPPDAAVPTEMLTPPALPGT